MADNIDVYVARVSVDGKGWNGSQVAEVVCYSQFQSRNEVLTCICCQAIKWAVEEKKVHIISISFGFSCTTKRLEPIRRAILKANAADVLIFAAASNKGGNEHVAFPARMDEVICVGSTNGRGCISDFTPHLDPGKRLCALGEQIESSWPPGMLDGGRKSGTSFATPVAARVAAMVLDYMWAVKDLDEPDYKFLIPKLLTRRGMLSVFKRMVVSYPTHDYLVPWHLFHSRYSGDVVEVEDEETKDIDGKATVKAAKERKPGMGIVSAIIDILRQL